jgi:glutaredoxin 3
MAKLELFTRPNCPYCQKVTKYMQEHKIAFPLRDINSDDKIRERLIKVGGKPQVPCLFIDGHAMYESDDIIFWLKNNWARQPVK